MNGILAVNVYWNGGRREGKEEEEGTEEEEGEGRDEEEGKREGRSLTSSSTGEGSQQSFSSMVIIHILA